MQNVTLDLEVRVTKRGEKYFAATTTPFAVTVYGETAEDAERTAAEAVRALLSQKKTASELMSFLDSRRVKYNKTTDATMVDIFGAGRVRPSTVAASRRELSLALPG